jgi:hypothetical protein
MARKAGGVRAASSVGPERLTMESPVSPSDDPSQVDTPAAPDHLSLALRIGLASHPRFAGAVHQRLILDCLYELPTQWLSLEEVIECVSSRYDGVRLTQGQSRNALGELRKLGWVDMEGGGRVGVPQYGLTAKGQKEWSEARGDGYALETRVKEAFLREIGQEPSSAGDARWSALLEALDRRFRHEAYDIACALLDSRGGRALVAEQRQPVARGRQHGKRPVPLSAHTDGRPDRLSPPGVARRSGVLSLPDES